MDPLIVAVMRHMLEDPNTLQGAMEAEIKNTLNSAANRNRQTTLAGSSSYGAGMQDLISNPPSLLKCLVLSRHRQSVGQYLSPSPGGKFTSSLFDVWIPVLTSVVF